MSSSPNLTRAGLSLLKIPDLKAICKELGVTAYSKLKKDQLVEKLVALGGVEAKVPSSTATIAPVDAGVGNIIKSSSKGHLPTQSGKESTSQEPLTTSTIHTASQVVSTLAPPVTSPQIAILIPPVHVKTPKKRTATPSNMDEETSVNTKRVKKAAVAVTGENSMDAPVEQVVRQIQAVPREVGAIGSGLMKPSSSKVDKVASATKVSRTPILTASTIMPVIKTSQAASTSNSKKTPKAKASPSVSFKPVPTENSMLPPSNGQPITDSIDIIPTATKLPPRQRRSTHTRTNTYKPVTLTLGPRKSVIKSVPPTLSVISEPSLDFLHGQGITTSSVPHLISSSWLGRMSRAVSTTKPFISNQLVATADLPALEVITRFIVARIHTSFQSSQWEDILDPLMVVEAGKVTSNNDALWVITTKGRRETMKNTLRKTFARKLDIEENDGIQDVTVLHLVVGSTGDVVATRRALIKDKLPSNVIDTFPTLRHDWRALISNDGIKSNLRSYIKTKNDLDYPHGISKIWGERAAVSERREEMRVAERYVLSNVLLSSISGSWMSMMQMDAGWVGQGDIGAQPKSQTVGLYLPESHQVESVTLHSSLSPRYPLHPSIAIVTRSTFTDYVLRATGQVIGSDEGRGVSELWQKLLGSDEKGIAVSVVDAESMLADFWSGGE